MTPQINRYFIFLVNILGWLVITTQNKSQPKVYKPSMGTKPAYQVYEGSEQHTKDNTKVCKPEDQLIVSYECNSALSVGTWAQRVITSKRKYNLLVIHFNTWFSNSII